MASARRRYLPLGRQIGAALGKPFITARPELKLEMKNSANDDAIRGGGKNKNKTQIDPARAAPHTLCAVQVVSTRI